MAFDLDFSGGENSDFLDSGGRLPAGWYRARFAGQEDIQDNGGLRMKFEVSYGPFAGQKVNRMLSNPRFADDAKKKQNAATNLKSWAFRMGIVTKQEVDSGVKKAVDYNSKIGTEYVIHVVPQKDYKTKEPNGFMEVAYTGVYPFAHHDIPPNVRTALALGPAATPAAGATTTAGATAPTQQPAPTPTAAADLWK